MIAGVNSNKCLDVSPGELGSPARLAFCDPGRPTQKFFLTEQGQLLSNGRCLEVLDGGVGGDTGGPQVEDPFQVKDNTPIRLAECDDAKLAQKFSYWGILSSSDNKCVQIDSSGDGRNGTRLVVGCNDGIATNGNLRRLTTYLFEFYFGEVEANLW